MYPPKTNAFFCSCWFLVAVAWHQKLMWLRNGAHITEEWRLNTNRHKRKCRIPEQHFEPACTLQSILSLSLSPFFSVIGDGSQNICADIEMPRHKHRSVLARDEEQFEAGSSAGKPWQDALLSYGFYLASRPLALLGIPLSCFGAAVLADFMLYVEDEVSFDFGQCIGSRILSFFLPCRWHTWWEV